MEIRNERLATQEENPPSSHRIIFKTTTNDEGLCNDEAENEQLMNVVDDSEANEFSTKPVILDYQSTPFYDCYQFGRLANSSNDFIIPGHLHMGEDGIYTSPVSRWAFRILCERLPPFRSFIFSGGFNDAKVAIACAFLLLFSYSIGFHRSSMLRRRLIALN